MIITLDFLKSDDQGTESARGKFLDITFKPVLNLLSLVVGGKLDDGTGCTLGDVLVSGVEWLEVEKLDTGVGLGRPGDGINDVSVDDILVKRKQSI